MKLILASLLAAIVSFAWGFVSWTVMGWHDTGRFNFKDEAAVKEVIKANADKGTGMYVLPFPEKAVSYADAAEQQKLDAAHQQARTEGPYLYAIVRPGGFGMNMPVQLAWSFARSFAAALLLGILLQNTVLSYPGRLGFCAAAGLFTGAAFLLQQHNWFGLPDRELIIGLADGAIEWLLAGVVLSLFLGRVPTERDVR